MELFMKARTNNKNTGNKGITLIALIITIIILLILAGITIIQFTGNGLFGKTEIAKQKTRYESAKEVVNLKLMEIQVDCMEKNEEYNIKKIAERMEEAEDITIEKYYNKEIAKIKDGINKEITDLKGIVVSVDRYSEYKFLIGEECEVKGVLQEEITEKTDMSEFKTLEDFEKEISVEESNKIPGVYYLYNKGNEYKNIAGEWVNNEKLSEYTVGKLTKEKEYMIYEAGTAYYNNPACTKYLPMDISEYDLICAEVELIGENGGTVNRNINIAVINENGEYNKIQTCHGMPGFNLNVLEVGKKQTITMNISNIQNLDNVYFGINANGYKFKIHSIYLKRFRPFKVIISDSSGTHYEECKIINGKGNEIKEDIDGRDYVHLDGTKYIVTKELTELDGNTEKTIMFFVRTSSSSQTMIMNLGDDSNGGLKMCIGEIYGYLRLYTDWYTAIYDARKDTLADNEWHFLCISYDKTKISLYYDNEKVFTTNITFRTVNPKLVIGAWNTEGLDLFTGDIRDVRVYNRSLSDEEINTIYSQLLY